LSTNPASRTTPPDAAVEAYLKNFGYFVEITDANIGGEANICIFQLHQFFKTP